MINIYITHGLSGSGKTTYLKELYNQLYVKYGYYSTKYINEEEVFIFKKENLEKFLIDNLKYVSESNFKNNYFNYVLIDTLSTTNNDLIKIINIIKKYIKKPFNITIDWSCIWNIENVKDINSINTLSFEEPNKELIFNETNIKVKLNSHEVQRKSKAMHFAHKYKLCGDDGIIESDTFSLGGTTIDCWGHTYFIESEDTDYFKEFDDIFEKISVNINESQYEELRNYSVEKETWDERDYYGGEQEIAKYVCYVENLITKMEQMNLIKF